MTTTIRRWLVGRWIIAACLITAPQAGGVVSDSRLSLKQGWAIQSSAKVTQTGEVISTIKFKPED